MSKTLLGMLAQLAGIRKATVEKPELTVEERAEKMRALAALDAIQAEIRAKSAEATPVSASVSYEREAQAIIEIMAEPTVKEFRFVGKLGWAWEVENSAGNDEINDLLRRHKKPVHLGQKLAEQLFKETAERAMGGPAKDSYIDEDGTNLALPVVPFSPYSDQGAAFFISLAYSWRGMAEQWNSQEKERIDAEKSRQQEEIAEYMAKHTQEMIKQMLEQGDAMKSMADDKADALAFVRKHASPLSPEALGSITPTFHESSGLSKIAAGLSMGQLKKSNY